MSHVAGPRRDFALLEAGTWTLAANVPWPQPRVAFDDPGHGYYNLSYLLICPNCGQLWCRSEAKDCPPEPAEEMRPRWCIRERYCASCMDAFFASRSWQYEYTRWHPTHCPGCIISVNRQEMYDTCSTVLWGQQLAALPASLRYRELALWARLDLLLNPLPVKEPALDVSTNPPPSDATQPIACT